MKFNKNDRVRVVKDITNSYGDVLGEFGTIKGISCTDNKNYVYFIDCDNNVSGWSNDKLNIESGHGISCLEEEIELILNQDEIQRYCTVQESLEQSLKEMQLMRQGKLPKKTWKEYRAEKL